MSEEGKRTIGELMDEIHELHSSGYSLSEQWKQQLDCQRFMNARKFENQQSILSFVELFQTEEDKIFMDNYSGFSDLREYDVRDMSTDIIWKENGAVLTATASIYVSEYDELVNAKFESVSKGDLITELARLHKKVLNELDAELWKLERDKQEKERLENRLKELQE